MVTIPEALDKPMRWRAPRRVFVNSMSDLFHKDVPDYFILQCFAVMGLCRRHTFQVLTKRPSRMVEIIERYTWGDVIASMRDEMRMVPAKGKAPDWLRKFVGMYQMDDTFAGTREGALGYEDKPRPSVLPQALPLQNVILGTTVENQPAADERGPFLRKLRIAGWTTFVSMEPLIGPVNPFPDGAPYWWAGDGHRDKPDWVGPHWIVVGGESGHHARPMHPDWPRAIRDVAVDSGIPFFFKQWGEYQNGGGSGPCVIVLTDGSVYDDQCVADGVVCNEHISETGGWRPELNPMVMARVGKKHAGRLLDGRTWDEYPNIEEVTCGSLR